MTTTLEIVSGSYSVILSIFQPSSAVCLQMTVNKRCLHFHHPIRIHEGMLQFLVCSLNNSGKISNDRHMITSFSAAQLLQNMQVLVQFQKVVCVYEMLLIGGNLYVNFPDIIMIDGLLSNQNMNHSIKSLFIFDDVAGKELQS